MTGLSLRVSPHEREELDSGGHGAPHVLVGRDSSDADECRPASSSPGGLVDEEEVYANVHATAYTSPDEEDVAHVRMPNARGMGGTGRYARLDAAADSTPSTKSGGQSPGSQPVVHRVRVHSIGLGLYAPPACASEAGESSFGSMTSGKLLLSPSPVNATGAGSPPCASSPLLLCVTLMGLVFVLCGLLVGISLSLQPNRADHVRQYNAVVDAWNRGERATFARASFAVHLNSPLPEPPPLPATTSSDGAHRRQAQQRRLLEDTTEESSSTASESSTGFESSSAASSSAESSSTAADTSSSTSVSSSTGVQSSTGSTDSSTASSTSDSSTDDPSPSSTGSDEPDPDPDLPPNSPFDPWLYRNDTRLFKVTSGDVLRDVGVDVRRYQPLYFAMAGTRIEDTSTVITPHPTTLYRQLPDLLLRNYSHARPWIDREDFSLNYTRVTFTGVPSGILGSNEFSLSELSISLPFLRQEISKTSAGACIGKLQGVYDAVHDTCLSFKQLSSICVRIKRLSRDELIAAQEARQRLGETAFITIAPSQLNLSALAWNDTRYVFDTDEIEGWGDAKDEVDDSTADATSVSSTVPQWSDALGSITLGLEGHALTVPGCIRHVTNGWQVGDYTSVPVTKYASRTSQATMDGHTTWHTMASSSAAAAAAASSNLVPLDRETDPDAGDVLLIALNVGSFNLSLRSRHDPYIMAQSITRSSLWFGLPVSEFILFTVLLVFIGLLLEVAPVYYTARWWALRKAAAAYAEQAKALEVPTAIAATDSEDEDGGTEGDDEDDLELSDEDDPEAGNTAHGRATNVQMTLVHAATRAVQTSPSTHPSPLRPAPTPLAAPPTPRILSAARVRSALSPGAVPPTPIVLNQQTPTPPQPPATA